MVDLLILGGSKRASLSSSATVMPLNFIRTCFPSPRTPRSAASVCSPLNISRTLSTFSGGTARSILSCDSEIQISQGAIPGYLRGTRSRWTSAPRPYLSAISQTAQLRPPPPRSVIPDPRPSSLICLTALLIFSSSMGLAICTAGLETSSDSSVSSAEAKVTPWIPSSPVLPPARTTWWPGFTSVTYLSFLRRPMQPA